MKPKRNAKAQDGHVAVTMYVPPLLRRAINECAAQEGLSASLWLSRLILRQSKVKATVAAIRGTQER